MKVITNDKIESKLYESELHAPCSMLRIIQTHTVLQGRLNKCSFFFIWFYWIPKCNWIVTVGARILDVLRFGMVYSNPFSNGVLFWNGLPFWVAILFLEWQSCQSTVKVCYVFWPALRCCATLTGKQSAD